MKTADYVTVGFVAVFVTILAYIAVNSLLGDPKAKSVRFDYLSGVDSSLSEPDEEIFNAAAINPTVEVYIGSCADLDQDGSLDEQERKACRMDAKKVNTDQTQSDYLQENGGLSNEENDTINTAEGYASGTTAEQRQAVEEDVQQYQQQQQQSTGTNSATNSAGTTNASDAARQETVSGS